MPLLARNPWPKDLRASAHELGSSHAEAERSLPGVGVFRASNRAAPAGLGATVQGPWRPPPRPSSRADPSAPRRSCVGRSSRSSSPRTCGHSSDRVGEAGTPCRSRPSGPSPTLATVVAWSISATSTPLKVAPRITPRLRSRGCAWSPRRRGRRGIRGVARRRHVDDLEIRFPPRTRHASATIGPGRTTMPLLTPGTTGFDVVGSVGGVASRGSGGLVKPRKTNKCGLSRVPARCLAQTKLRLLVPGACVGIDRVN
jgi:hypothetical protein